MNELTFTITGMHCASCALLIDDAVEEISGVTSSATDRRAGRTTVVLAKLNQPRPEQIVAAINELGYRADRIS